MSGYRSAPPPTRPQPRTPPTPPRHVAEQAELYRLERLEKPRTEQESTANFYAICRQQDVLRRLGLEPVGRELPPQYRVPDSRTRVEQIRERVAELETICRSSVEEAEKDKHGNYKFVDGRKMLYTDIRNQAVREMISLQAELQRYGHEL